MSRPAFRLAASAVATALLLAGCAVPRAPTLPRGGADGPPAEPPADIAKTPDAEPRIETIRAGGPNKPYQIGGIDYTPRIDDRPRGVDPDGFGVRPPPHAGHWDCPDSRSPAATRGLPPRDAPAQTHHRESRLKHVDESRITPEIVALYERLKHGEGRDEVDEHNAGLLMWLAARDGHTVLQEELREWKAN